MTINPDLILHSRGEIPGRDNLIAIEMKKAQRPEMEKIQDRTRLRAMTKSNPRELWSADGITQPEHVCGYELGVYIELDVRSAAYRVEEYRAGHLEKIYEGEL